MTKRSVDLTSAAAPGEGIPHPSYQGIRPMAALFKSLVFGIVQWVFFGCLWYVTVTFVFPCVAYLWITAGAGWTIVICAVGGFLHADTLLVIPLHLMWSCRLHARTQYE